MNSWNDWAQLETEHKEASQEESRQIRRTRMAVYQEWLEAEGKGKGFL